MQIEIVRLDASHVDDFYCLHSDVEGAGCCYCAAWWVESWEEWSQRDPEQNRVLRQQLFTKGTFDGYLMYDGTSPIGWCQCCPRDWLPKIRETYNLMPDSEIWAICCFLILPQYREIGLANHFLEEIVKDLTTLGVKHVQGFPKRGKELQAGDLWTGPEAMFLKAGFRLEQDDDRHPVFGLRLAGGC
jgi:hypothetical protein